MESKGDIRILRTSSLWETKAMYVEDQGNFVNGACEVSAISSLILGVLPGSDKTICGKIE